MQDLEELKSILQGINQEEVYSPDGWWETETGANFGAGKLNDVIALFSRLIARCESAEEDLDVIMSHAASCDIESRRLQYELQKANEYHKREYDRALKAEAELKELREQKPLGEFSGEFKFENGQSYFTVRCFDSLPPVGTKVYEFPFAQSRDSAEPVDITSKHWSKESELLRSSKSNANDHIEPAHNDSAYFKNFHRLLCERFGYSHDDKDWRRDQASLIEHIASQQSPAVAVPDEIDVSVLDAVSEALGDCYDCMRTWSAWGVGTMSQNDFIEVRESSERVDEIARAAITAFLAAPQPDEKMWWREIAENSWMQTTDRAWFEHCQKSPEHDTWLESKQNYSAAPQVSAEQPEGAAPEQKPVAWRKEHKVDIGVEYSYTSTLSHVEDWAALGVTLTPLYANPFEQSAAPKAQSEMVLISKEIVEFLNGSRSIDGVWFDQFDEQAKTYGKYGWRKYLPKIAEGGK